MYPYRVSLLLGALVVGLVLGSGLQGLPWALAVSAGICAQFAVHRLNRRSSSFWSALLPLIFLLGTVLAPCSAELRASEGYSLGQVTLVGTIVARPCGAPGENLALLRLSQGIDDGPSAGECVYLRLDAASAGPEWGWRARARGDLFVYGIHKSPAAGSLQCNSLEMLSRPTNPVRRVSNLLRRHVQSFCSHLPARSGGLLAGIILGDYRCLDPGDAASLKLSGLIHLCSASGLHVGIILIICLWVSRRIRLGRRGALLMQLPLLLVYCMAAGMTPPIIRSAVVAALATLSFFRAREFDFIAAMSTVALGCLVLTPELLGSASFQLTYMAAAGCVLLAHPFAKMLGIDGSRAGRLFSTSLGAQIGIAPLLLHHFGEFSLLAPFSNLAVLPLIPAVMTLGLAGACLTWLPAGLLRFLVWPLQLLLRLLLRISEITSAQSWAAVFNPGLSLVWLLFWYILLWLGFLRRPAATPRRLRRTGCCLIAAALLALWNGTPLQAGPGVMCIEFLDVGQGDAMLVRDGSGHCLLVDGGPDADVLAGKLRARGIRRLDLVVLTHPHSDHMGALPEVARRWPVGCFVFNGEHGEGVDALLDFLAGKHTAIHAARAGESLSLAGMNMRVLAPASVDSAEGNENSLVLRLQMEDLAVLLAGDIQEQGERVLLDKDELLRSDILKVPHHGGSSPTNREFFHAVHAAFACIEVGRGNSFGHPALSTLQQLRQEGSRVFRTDECGDIVFTNPEGRIVVQTERRP